VRLVNFVRFEKINGDFRKILGGYLKINGANWKMFGRLLANDCCFRNFTLSFWANSNWRYYVFIRTRFAVLRALIGQ
jgi:hypothetical protein